MNKRKAKLVISIIVLSIILLTGCSSKKELVKLTTKQEMVKKVKKEYGKANYISQENITDSTIYNFSDNEYNFIYKCKSSVV